MIPLLLVLVPGGLAGWLAARLIRGQGPGFWGNIGVGIVGALLGGLLLAQLGVRLLGPFGQFATALLGAVILPGLARLSRRGR
jgi:uncharacterized membrane protein YeaQ/YmgE (transglycosylase-associated protein family)